jgi:transcription antitermination factor NusB
MALQMLYQIDLGESALPAIFSSFDVAEYLGEPRAGSDSRAADRREGGERHRRQETEIAEAFAHARELVEGTQAHRGEIDALIREQAANWRLERMPAVDRNILRLAIFEMLHQADVPKLVVVDEAIELAKKFGSEHSGRFVNGLLDGLLKHHSFPGSLK